MGTVYNIRINGHGHHCAPPMSFHYGGFNPGCFGFGYSHCGNDPFLFGAGAGLGMAAGMALIPALPTIFKGIGKGCEFLWNKVLEPGFGLLGKGLSFVWNKAIVPGAKGLWSGIKATGKFLGEKVFTPIGKGIVNGAKAVWGGIKKLWNKIF